MLHECSTLSVVAVALMLIAQILLGFSSSFHMMVFAFVLICVGYGIAGPAFSSVLADSVPHDQR